MEEQYYCAALLYAGCEGHGPPHLQLQLRGQGLHSQLWWDTLIQNVVIPPLRSQLWWDILIKNAGTPSYRMLSLPHSQLW